MNVFGGDIGQLGRDAFGQLFGIMDTKDTKSINQPTQGNWTKTRARSMQGGAEPTGFWAPPAISDFRSEGIHKDRPSTGNEILSFWITVPGNIKVGQTFDYGPWANYGTVEKAMVWDVNGYVMGGYTKTLQEKVKVLDRHKQVIEKWDPELGVWNKISERDTTNGTAGFQEQGHYRITVALYRSAFRLAPQYGTVTVEDPRFDRKNSLIYYEISAKLPSPFSGIGMTISGYGKPERQFSANEGFRKDCGTYDVRAMAKQGIVDWETNSSRMMKSSTNPEYYKNASWVLRGKDASILWKTEDRESFLFDANYWGDGQYTLETHLSKQHQGQGIQNMTVQPAITYITVNQCGPSRHQPPKDETKAFEGDTTKETINIPDIDPNKFVQLDGNNMKVVPHGPLFEIVNHNLPKDTPNPPADICKDCTKLQQQISHRTRQLQIECDTPALLMEQMLKAPKRYEDMEKDLAKEWEAIVIKAQAFRDPFTKLAIEYTKLVMTAYREGLVISAEDQAKYRPTDQYGNPSVLGYGIPNGYCVFDKKKVELANQLRAEQKKIYEQWAALRQDAAKKALLLEKEVEAANKRFEDYFEALLNMRADLNKMQMKLSEIYHSGKYEHCLGGGGIRTSGDYTIVSMDGKQQKDPAWGLPGMNIQLPEPKKKILDPAILKVPKPLHEIQPLKIKWDGIKQLETDRKLMESLADAKRLQYEAEYGSWSNWVGSKLMWLAETAVELSKYNPATAPISYLDNIIKNVNSGMPMDKALDKAYQESYGAIAEVYQKAGTWAYDAMFKKPFSETKKDLDKFGTAMIELVPKIFEGLGNDVAKYVHANTDVLKELEKDMDELNNLAKYGDSPEANTQRIAIYQRQMMNWQKMEEGGKAMDNLIMTVATSNTALNFAKYVGGQANVALNGIKEFLKESMLQSKNLGAAVGQNLSLAAKATYLDDMARAGNVISDKVDDAIRGARETARTGSTQLDDAFRAQKEASKQLADKLDDAVKKVHDKIDKLDPPSKWEPIKKADIDPSKLGNTIGSGSTATVKQAGEGKVAKILDKFVDPENADNILSLKDFDPTTGKKLSSQKLQEVLEKAVERHADEASGLLTMKEADIPFIKTTGQGSTKMQVMTNQGIKEVNVPVFEKAKFTSNQETLQNIMKAQNGQMTRKEMVEALEYYNKAANKGVVFLDPNSGNLVKEMLPDGNFRYLATEGGSVYKVGNAQQAREMMVEMLTAPVAKNPNGTTNVVGTLFDMSERFTRIGGEKASSLLEKAADLGFSFSDRNLAKHIDKDLLEAFKNPEIWEKTVKEARRASALANKAQYLDDAAQAVVNNLQQSAVSNQQVIGAVQNTIRKAPVVEKEIKEVINVAVPTAIYGANIEKVQQATEKGEIDSLQNFFNDSWFGPISFRDMRQRYYDTKIADAA
ncbi:MAG: hypothetical protein N3D15_00355 [Syntrophorhabdaceae bacterium]|nr:hypothetical protein [Syntrophorhabdaceae bacterium]